jgi:H+-transporting ATPase
VKTVFQTSTTEHNSCLYVPRYNFQVFAKGVDADTVVLMAAQASRIENQDAIDTAIVGMLADPKEVIGPYGIFFLNFWSLSN